MSNGREAQWEGTEGGREIEDRQEAIYTIIRLV